VLGVVLRTILFKLLFVRLIQTQLRTLLAALLTLSLGIALAMGIRLGTESAQNGLENGMGALSRGGWVGPIEFRTQEAAKAFVPLLAGRSYIAAKKFVLVDDSQPQQDVPRQFDLFVIQGAGGLEVGEGQESGSSKGDLAAIANEVIRGEPEPLTPGKAVVWANKVCAASVGSIGAFRGSSGSGQASPTPVEWRFFDMETANCQMIYAPPARTQNWNEFSHYVDTIFVKVPGEPSFIDGQKVEADVLRFVAQVPGASFEPRQQRLSDLRQLTQSMRVNLQLMGFVAIIIGVFMVNHVMSVVIRRQSRVFGILGAHGIGFARQAPPLVLLVVVLGLAAAVLGSLGGWLCGRFVAELAGRSFRALYDRQIDPDLFVVKGSEFVWAGFLGFATAVAGAAIPLWRLWRMDTAEVIRTGGWQERVAGSVPVALRNPVVLLISFGFVVAVLVRFPVFWGRQPVSAYLLCFVILLAASAAVAPALAFVTQMIRGGFAGLNQRFLVSQIRLFVPPQSAVMLQVLLLCFALTFGVRTMSESFRTSLVSWSERTIRADLWIRHSMGSGEALPEAVIARVSALKSGPGNTDLVQAIDGLRVQRAQAMLENGVSFPIVVNAVDLEEQALVAPLDLLDSVTGEPWSIVQQKQSSESMASRGIVCSGDLESPCPAYISKSLAVRLEQQGGIREAKGGLVTVRIGGKEMVFEPQAHARDFGNDSGAVLVDANANAIARFLGDPSLVLPGFMNVYLQPGALAQVETMRKELQEQLGNSAEVLSGAELRGQIMTTFEETFAITDALYLLSSIIAFVTVICSLGLQILTRANEWTILWASGLSTRQLRWRLALWSGHTSLFALLLSLPVGLILAAVLVYVVNYHAFGFLLQLDVPWVFGMCLAVLAWLVGALGGAFVSRSLQSLCKPQQLHPE
jgi:putative ABC transport system permease protein